MATNKLDTPTQLLHNKQFYGRRVIEAVSRTIINNSNGVIAAARAGLRFSHNESDASNEDLITDTDWIENADPERRRIIRSHKRPWILRKIVHPIRDWWKEKHRPLTDEELTRLAQIKQQEIENKARMADAAAGELKIIQTLTRLGYCKKKISDGRDFISDTFGIDLVIPTRDVIYYHIGHYPDGPQNTATNITSENVLNDLMVVIGHRVRAEVTADHGVVFAVEIASSAGIPTQVTWGEMIAARPAGAGPTSFALGKSAGGRTEWRDIDDGPHWLIAGSTGFGKSVMLNSIICSIISYPQSSKAVRFVLIDCKMTELTHYGQIPHLLRNVIPDVEDGIATTPQAAMNAIRWARIEVDIRKKLFAGKFRDIFEYNRKHAKNPLPSIVLVFDEIGSIALSEHGEEFNREMADLTNICRAFGFYVIAATQKPQANVVDTRITFNMDARIAFRCPTHQSSMIVLNTGDAVTLQRPGQMLFQHKGRVREIQGCFITTAHVHDVITAVVEGKTIAEVQSRGLQPEQVVQWAADNNNYSLDWESTWKEFEPLIAKDKLTELLKGIDNKTFSIDGSEYTVTPSRGKLARRLTRVISDDGAPQNPSSVLPDQLLAEKKQETPPPVGATDAQAWDETAENDTVSLNVDTQ